MKHPLVGVGVILQNKEKKILIGKRKGSHAPYFSIPGGHLELGETFETAANREIMEECGIRLKSVQVICVTNNLRTYQEEGKHFISVTLFSDDFEGVPILKEPNKCEGWNWYDPNDIPSPHYDASEYATECLLKNKFYIPNQEL